ncbi:hypothetical protein ABZW10_36365 [Kitasatospora sp. NPDC004723]|uniref:hypothetical protein n=1 Tax=Kitasatospora sp. NPDC004723 TaxID=3154288 RepID=UPI0033AFD5E5
MTTTSPTADAVVAEKDGAEEDLWTARQAAHRYLEARQAEAETELARAQARLAVARRRVGEYRRGGPLTDTEARLVVFDALEEAVRTGRQDAVDPTGDSAAAYEAAQERARAIVRGLRAAGHRVDTTDPTRKDAP